MREERRLVRTRVVCNTLAKRGKSFTPWSRVLIDEERVDIVSRSEETQPWSECAIFSNNRFVVVTRIVDIYLFVVYAYSNNLKYYTNTNSRLAPQVLTRESSNFTTLTSQLNDYNTTTSLHTIAQPLLEKRKWVTSDANGLCQSVCLPPAQCLVEVVELTFKAQPMAPFYVAGMLPLPPQPPT